MNNNGAHQRPVYLFKKMFPFVVEILEDLFSILRFPSIDVHRESHSMRTQMEFLRLF